MCRYGRKALVTPWLSGKVKAPVSPDEKFVKGRGSLSSG